MTLTAKQIITFFERQARRPLAAGDILAAFHLNRKEYRAALRLLAAMAEEGTLVRLKGDRYSLPRQLNLVTGRVSVHRDGYGFVAAEGAAADVFVPTRFLREVMDGDLVVVRVERSGRDGKSEGRVIKVLERAHQTVVGLFEAGRSFGYVIPTDPRIGHDIYIPEQARGGAMSGQVVVARIDAYPRKNRNPEGTIVDILGAPEDPEVEIRAIVHRLGIPYSFSAEVQAEAAAVCGEVREEERAGREDLREIPLVTIDGETAKDFDDAVAVRRETGGAVRLWVAIADVGHYVPEGSAIDREAFERGTSVYFPGRCVPMLPEALSNGICSLNPGVDRLAMVAEMLFDGGGGRCEERYYPAVIRSQARLTYTQVREVLEEPERSSEALPEGLEQDLGLMRDLAERLMAMRRQRGSLDFDLPEAEIVLDLQGRPENVVRSERSIAHRIIEEFMLAANEAVAAFLTARKVPILYRVHESPDREKLEAFQEFIAHFNYGVVIHPEGVDPRQLQKLLAEMEGRPEEQVINQVLLRSMKQASYAPENIGHFGLAADPYCHFTSPIRRYPDLVVHRALRTLLEKGPLSEAELARRSRSLPAAGEHLSRCERRAMEAERDIVALKKCQFMLDKVDEVFAGFVSGVQAFGFFVELEEIFVEGLVHISSLGDDFYHYEEDLHRLVGQHRRRIFQVGEQLQVRVRAVNLERREIDLELAEEAQVGGPKAR